MAPAVRVSDLLAMGFPSEAIHAAIDMVGGDMHAAQEFLLDGTLPPSVATAVPASSCQAPPPSESASSHVPRVRDKSPDAPPAAHSVMGPGDPAPGQQPAGLVILDPD